MSERMSADDLVLVFPIIKNTVLLSVRKKSPWKGRLSGLGGGFIVEDHCLLNTVVREAKEEARIRINPLYLEKRAEILIQRSGKRQQMLHIYVCRHFDGTPSETDEMGPHMFFPISDLPFEKMVEGDEKWLPHIFGDKVVRGTIWRSSDAEIFSGCEIALL